MKLTPDVHTEVLYNDPEHKYYLGDIIYRSATQIVEQFVNEFDTEERAEYMVYRYGKTADYWKAKWKEENSISLSRGTLLHNEREDYLHNRGFDTINNTHFRVYNLNAPNAPRYHQTPGGYFNLPDGTYPELKLWRHDWHIAGRVDKPTIETLSGTRYMHIDDYKTNKALDDQSYYEHRTGKFRMMLGPLSHLMDCNKEHYTLQLSIYQYMAEYFGFEPGTRRIIHYPHAIPELGTPPPRIYELPYYREEVIAMLKHLKLHRWLN